MKKILTFSIALSIIIFFNSCAPKKPQEEIIKTAKYHFKVGISYLNSGNLAEAIYNLNKAYALDKNNVDILNALGIAYSKVGELDKAQQYFLEAIKINPKKIESYVNLGVLLAQKKDYGSALENFKIAANSPDYKSKEKVYYNMALIYKNLGNLNDYENKLKKSIAYNSFFLPAYEELGKYYIRLDEFDKAQKIYEKAISIGLGSPDIYYNLGLLNFKKKNYKLAKYYLKKALLLYEKDISTKRKIKKLLSQIINKPEKKEEKKEINKITVKNTEKPKVIIYPSVKENSFSYIPRKPIVKKKEKKKTTLGKISKKTEKKVKKVIRFYINLGTFSEKKEAKNTYNKLKLYGYYPKIEKINVDGKIYYIVYIGYFENYLKASRFYKKNLKPIGFKGIIKFKRIKYEPEKKG